MPVDATDGVVGSTAGVVLVSVPALSPLDGGGVGPGAALPAAAATTPAGTVVVALSLGVICAAVVLMGVTAALVAVPRDRVVLSPRSNIPLNAIVAAQ